MIDVKSIINKWIEITEYDKDQRSFNLLSSNYAFHRAGDFASKLTQYDRFGYFTVLYLKASFESICKGIHVSLIDCLKDPSILKDYMSMWELFESPEFRDLERSTINTIIGTTNMNKAIGQADISYELDMFRDSVEYIAEELSSCKTEAFYLDPSTTISNNIKFHSNIEVANTTTECVLRIEKSDDGLYLCYITDYNSCGGYFAYMLKSGNNIISINDRIDESFVGQHTRSRNNRFIEDKKWHIFPYSDVIEPEGSDYKGYAKSLKCTQNQFEIRNLSNNFKYTVMLAAYLIMQRFSGMKLSDILEEDNIEVVYVDSMMNNSANLSETNAIVPIDSNSLVVKTNRQLSFDFDSDNVKSDEFNNKYNYQDNRNRKYSGSYRDINKVLIETYGEGFHLNSENVLVRQYPKLTDGDSDTVVSEFIGPKDKIEMEYYRQCRLQLRNYIVNKMIEEYAEFGGYDAVINWYEKAIHDNKENLIQRCIRFYKDVQEGIEHSCDISNWGIPCGDSLSVSILEGADRGKYIPRQNPKFIVNEQTSESTFRCPITGKNANVWFVFQPNTYQNIEKLVDKQVPKILEGFKYSGYDGSAGNNLIHSCDPVGFIENPFACHRSFEIQKNFPGVSSEPFNIAVGLSKLGINRLLKQI